MSLFLHLMTLALLIVVLVHYKHNNKEILGNKIVALTFQIKDRLQYFILGIPFLVSRSLQHI